jgi:hypothetical protein
MDELLDNTIKGDNPSIIQAMFGLIFCPVALEKNLNDGFVK